MPRRTVQKSEDAYRTISEVAEELEVPQHVLRFWETKFKSLEPLKRAGGRRYYRPEDLDLLKKIHFLLYTKGYTIKGVQKLLSGAKNITAELVGISEHFELKTERSPSDIIQDHQQEQANDHKEQDHFERANDELPFEFPEQPKNVSSNNDDLKQVVVTALKDILLELKSLKEQLDTTS